MINYPTKPQTLFTIEEIAAQIQSGEYSAELLLMHLCHRVDETLNCEINFDSWDEFFQASGGISIKGVKISPTL